MRYETHPHGGDRWHRDHDGGRGAARQAFRVAGAAADLDDVRPPPRRPRVEARHLSLLQAAARPGASRLGVDVPGAHDGHRIQRRHVPHVRASAGPGHGVAHLDLRADRATEHLEPGTCADGSPRIGRRTLRAHGNHNPQHGGQFFMAPDNWHHLEGVHPSARVFRLYVYDDYGRPLAAAKVKDDPGARRHQGNVRSRDAEDDRAQRVSAEAVAQPSAISKRASIPATLPAEMTAKVKFGGDQPEHRFDFTFAVALEGAGRADVVRLSTQPLAAPTPRHACGRPWSSELDPLTPRRFQPR